MSNTEKNMVKLPTEMVRSPSLKPLRQGRRWLHDNERARYSDEVTRTEPDRRRASRHDQRNRRRRERNHRLPRVSQPDGS
ncbi:hypothetical protein YC2023_054900 [Brassica napus]